MTGKILMKGLFIIFRNQIKRTITFLLHREQTVQLICF